MNNKYVNQSFDYLRGIPQLLEGIFKTHVESLLRIRNKERLGTNASQSDMFRAEADKKNETEALKTETLKKLADVSETAKAKEETALRHLDRILGGRTPTSDVQQNLLMETREQKAWARIKPLLDRHSDVDGMNAEIKSLVSGFILTLDPSPAAYDSSDYDSLSSLKKELPFYIKGRFTGAEAEVYAEQTISALEDALGNIRPEYKEAVNLKKELRPGMIQTDLALNYVRHAVENNESQVVVPAWEKGKAATLK